MTAVRYYSRSGNTKLVADAIAEALGTRAVSVDQPDASLEEAKIFAKRMAERA